MKSQGKCLNTPTAACMPIDKHKLCDQLRSYKGHTSIECFILIRFVYICITLFLSVYCTAADLLLMRACCCCWCCYRGFCHRKWHVFSVYVYVQQTRQRNEYSKSNAVLSSISCLIFITFQVLLAWLLEQQHGVLLRQYARRGHLLEPLDIIASSGAVVEPTGGC